MTDTPDFVQDHKSATTEDQLSLIRDRAAFARDLEKQIADLEERLKEQKALLYNLYHQDLVDMMDEAGIDQIGLPAHGNMPPVDAKLQPYYHAVIPANWPPEKRDQAFHTLERFNAGDLIKTEVSILFPREEHGRVAAFLDWLSDLKVVANIKESVHHGTLTAWLREQVEHGRPCG